MARAAARWAGALAAWWQERVMYEDDDGRPCYLPESEPTPKSGGKLALAAEALVAELAHAEMTTGPPARVAWFLRSYGYRQVEWDDEKAHSLFFEVSALAESIERPSDGLTPKQFQLVSVLRAAKGEKLPAQTVMARAFGELADSYERKLLRELRDRQLHDGVVRFEGGTRGGVTSSYWIEPT